MIRTGVLLAGLLVPAVAGAAEGTPVVDHGKSFSLRTADDRFELTAGGRLQARWEMFRDGAETEELEHRFSLPRARLVLEGRAFGDTAFKFQAEFGKGYVTLRDYYLDHPVGPVRLRVGQAKKPFSRQQMTSSGSLQLVDRSPTDDFSGAGRDIGVALHDGHDRSTAGLEWALGVYNGTGDRGRIACTTESDSMTLEATTRCGTPSNIPGDIGPMVVARAGLSFGGLKGYSESDLERGPLRGAVAIGYMGDLAEGASESMVHRAAVDGVVKLRGLSLTAAGYLVHRESDGETRNDLGVHVQGGAFVLPGAIELAARFSHIQLPGGDLQELLGGVNWFAHGHALKWQTDAGVLRTAGGEPATELVVRTQAQLSF